MAGGRAEACGCCLWHPPCAHSRTTLRLHRQVEQRCRRSVPKHLQGPLSFMLGTRVEECLGEKPHLPEVLHIGDCCIMCLDVAAGVDDVPCIATSTLSTISRYLVHRLHLQRKR